MTRRGASRQVQWCGANDRYLDFIWFCLGRFLSCLLTILSYTWLSYCEHFKAQKRDESRGGKTYMKGINCTVWKPLRHEIVTRPRQMCASIALMLFQCQSIPHVKQQQPNAEDEGAWCHFRKGRVGGKLKLADEGFCFALDFSFYFFSIKHSSLL